MPHLRIEYSPGLAARLDMDGLCRAAHRAMVETGVFPLAGIRVRAFCADHCIVADDHPDNDFAALILTVGAGRTTETLQQAGAHIWDAVRAYLAEPLASPHFALSLDIRESNPDLSWKDTPIHGRLSKKD
ncbi:5-carboxymethyl-2-hydroxymuconate Delta-isomerase [Tropicibacter naphthalenivorans]|uniref:5-carboxymethyl-2-hydroxymuconate Delta-isomerase n=1 Tax=Tropicibacter naphthalenivorans TaxID=441103 RepID=A0A0P1GH97_9RHOB|nr:5-carboxymethyl-2-hydroxymuconate Delta-isomerase [Tropicibacter naphthalenivorans]CUH81064.1 5-carboxymethyl-2-hydroxymuconate Delta-isomerase [Tropicibacter naphthalenivorans]SMC96967.1 5-carboxymethyl-2-hydroxymuconate isomerase [Tropicibacter naphthalenivorans]